MKKPTQTTNMKFAIGDKVVALNSKECNINPRVQGKEYTVLSVMNCPGCNEEMIAITEPKDKLSLRIRCASCNDTRICSNYPWTLASNFRSANHFDPYEELQLAIKRENYERAAELRDMINADHERQRD